MDLDLVCANCGAILEASFNGRHEVEIELCSVCENSIREEAGQKGYDEGYDKGYSEAE